MSLVPLKNQLIPPLPVRMSIAPLSCTVEPGTNKLVPFKPPPFRRKLTRWVKLSDDSHSARIDSSAAS